MKYYKCVECGKDGHIKCTKESHSLHVKINTKVLNDLNEFIIQKFREAEISESDEDHPKRNPELNDVDAFDYVNDKKKKHKKLTKT